MQTNIRPQRVKLIGDFPQDFPGDTLSLTVGVEETRYTLRLLERLDQTVEQQPVKTPILELDAFL
jgi:hypothetical protein